MHITSERAVREIAAEQPSSVAVFESLGIDYCCGGRRSLADACSTAGVDLGKVLLLLDSAERDTQPNEAEDWNARPLAELTAHIVETHHGFVRNELTRLPSLFTKVVSKHGPAHPETAQIEALFGAMGQELSMHMFKEEQILFPYIDKLEQARTAGGGMPQGCFGSVRQPIANMIAEHDDAGALLTQIRNLSNGYKAPAGACPTFKALYQGLEAFERDLHHHIHLENNILFPRAIKLES